MCPAAASSRWCPTPEQLMILEEMYIGGIRTPNASQIQQITVHLSFYGKIEGKNVFYWFQNHKARDRQKLRRKLNKQLYQQQQQQQHNHEQNHHHQWRNQDFYQTRVKGGVVDASTQMMSCTLKTDHPPDSCEIDKAMITRTYGRDWMMMMLDVGPTPTSPCCNKVKPPKTLELFPITATGHKDKHCATSKHIPSSSSTN